MIHLNLSNRNRIIIAVTIFFIFGFMAGMAFGAYQAINWVVDVVVKILNTQGGAGLISDLLRLRSVGSDVMKYFPNGTMS